MSDTAPNPYRPPIESGPPPEPELAPPRLSRYVSGSKLAKGVVGLLVAMMCISGVDVACWFVIIAAGVSQSIPPEAIVLLAASMRALAVVHVVCFWTNALVFCAWMYRAYSNVQHAFQVAGLRYSPVWASGAFFLPFAQVFVPYRVAREIWVGSHEEVDNMRSARATSMDAGCVANWWGLFLSMGVVNVVLNAMTPVVPIATYCGVLSPLVTIAAAWAAIRMVRGVEALQQRRAASAEPFDAAKVVERNAPVVHRCASCGAPYDPADYSEEAAHIYCGSCKAELPRGKEAPLSESC